MEFVYGCIVFVGVVMMLYGLNRFGDFLDRLDDLRRERDEL